MKTTTAIQIALDELRRQVIGIYRNPNKGAYELVTAVYGDESFDCIHISAFGGVSESYGCLRRGGQLEFFSDNMFDTLNDVFAWSEFMKRFEI